MTPVTGEGAHGTCPGCNTTTLFEGARRGDPVLCPSCGAMFDARLRSTGGAPATQVPPPAREADPIPSSSPGAATSGLPSRGREIAIAAGIGALALLVILVARQLLRDPGLELAVEAQEGLRLHTRGRAELRFERVTERGGFVLRQNVLQVDDREQFDTVTRVSATAVQLSRVVTRAVRQQMGEAGLVMAETHSPLQHRTLAIQLAGGRATITEGATVDAPRETSAFVAVALPAEPVWPGDRWPLTAADLPTLLELDTMRVSRLQGSAVCRLDALETMDGERSARLVVDLQASWRDADQGATVRAQGEVRLWYSLAKRRFFILDGEIPVRVEADGATSTGTLKVSVRVTPR